MFFSFFILAIAYSWTIGWVADVGNYVKVRLGKVEELSHRDVVPEETLKIFQSGMKEVLENDGNPSLNRTETKSIADHRVAKLDELSSNFIQYTTKATNSLQSMTENKLDLTSKSPLNNQRDMIAESLEGLYKKLDEIEQTNASQFRKIAENFQASDKRFKEQEDAIKSELQSISRRFENRYVQ